MNNKLKTIEKITNDIGELVGQRVVLSSNKQTLNLGEGNMAKRVWEDIVQRERKDNAIKASEQFVYDGKHNCRLIASSSGIVAQHKNNSYNVRLSTAQVERLTSDPDEVCAEILGDLERFASGEVKTISEQLVPLNEGIEDNKTINEFNEVKRHNIPENDKTLSDLVSGYNKGENTHDKTLDELLEETGLYMRQGVDDEAIHKALYNDAKAEMRENDDVALGVQIDDLHKKCDDEPTKVANAVVSILGRTASKAQLLPEEAIELALGLASKINNFDTVVKLSSAGVSHRESIAQRSNLHNKPLSLSPKTILINELGVAVREFNVTPLAVANGIVGLYQAKDVVKKLVNDYVVANPNKTVVSSNKGVSLSPVEKIALAYNTLANTKVEELKPEHYRSVTEALASTVLDKQITARELVSQIKDFSYNDLVLQIELNRTDNAVEQRLANRERASLYRLSSNEDTQDVMFGWLADYSVANEYPTNVVASTLHNQLKQADVLESLITRLVKASRTKESSIEITDEKVTTKRLICNVSDLEGLDTKDPNFEESFRQKAIEILSNNGFEVDPQTFQMSDLSVTSDGCITATISSRFSKTIKAEDSAPSVGVDTDTPTVGVDTISEMPSEEVVAPEATAEPTETYGDDTVITQAAKKHYNLVREAIMNSTAQQQTPFMGIPSNGAPAPSGGQMTQNMADAIGGDTLNVPTEAGGNPGEEPVDTDGINAPGQKQPFGTICPMCGSSNVSLSNGEGSCKDCSTNYKVTFKLEVMPDDEKGGDDPANTDDTLVDAATPDASQAATPDAGGMGMPAPNPMDQMGGGAPPAMPTANAKNRRTVESSKAIMKISYKIAPEVWVSYAESFRNKTACTKYPVGMICPTCGDKEKIVRTSGTTICRSCNELFAYKVQRTEDGDFIASIKKII